MLMKQISVHTVHDDETTSDVGSNKHAETTTTSLIIIRPDKATSIWPDMRIVLSSQRRFLDCFKLMVINLYVLDCCVLL